VSGYVIEPLGPHDRGRFSSGSNVLDRYFRQQVTQDVRRKLTNCFVAVAEGDEVAGFYTFASTSVPLDKLAEERARRLPRYPAVPAILLGRLAVAAEHQGRGLGAMLLADALLRACKADAAAHMLVVDAMDEAAVRFYAHHGFERLPDDGRRLVRVL
jgi:ribosomal protein S18 acetylase RimI-like enzyme